MLSFAGFTSLLLLIPYLGWGIYTLRKRYVLREELPLKVEGATLVLLVLFFAMEINLSRHLLVQDRLTHILAILGLFVSGTALYGPMLNAFFSRIIVDLLTHGHDSAPDQPRFGPAETLEYHGDDEGALKEYAVIARIYPWHPGVYLRIAEVCLRLKQSDEAVAWLDRGLKHVKTAQESQAILLRLCDIFSTHLDNAEASHRILRDFIDRFPNSPEGETLRARLEKNPGDFCTQVSTLLEDMQELSLSETEHTPKEVREEKAKIGLIALENTSELPVPKEDTTEKKSKVKIELEALDGDGQNNR